MQLMGTVSIKHHNSTIISVRYEYPTVYRESVLHPVKAMLNNPRNPKILRHYDHRIGPGV